VIHNGRRSRAIRIGDPNDIALLKAVCRGEFATAEFRNRDLQRLLHPVRSDTSPKGHLLAAALFAARGF
jgi:hypothetical protein